MRSIFLAVGLLSLAFTSTVAFAKEAEVPKAAQGVWAKGGQCQGETVTLTADTLKYKGAQPQSVYFVPKESPSSHGAIHYKEEGSVDNFEYAADKDHLIYNPEGFGMGKSVLYTRCH